MVSLLDIRPTTLVAKVQAAEQKGDIMALAALSMKAARVYQRAIDLSREAHYSRCSAAWELAGAARDFAFNAAISIHPEDAPKDLKRAMVLATRTIARTARDLRCHERARRVSILFAAAHSAMERLYASR